MKNRTFWFLQGNDVQKISEQIQLDKNILDLLDEIDVALDLAPDEDTLRSRCEKSDHHKKTLTRLLEQITECGHFIQSYVKDVNFGTCFSHSAHTRFQRINHSGNRLLKHFVSNGKTVVDNFRRMLRKLREDFVSEVIVNVETDIFRIIEEVESIDEDVRAVGKSIKQVGE